MPSRRSTRTAANDRARGSRRCRRSCLAAQRRAGSISQHLPFPRNERHLSSVSCSELRVCRMPAPPSRCPPHPLRRVVTSTPSPTPSQASAVEAGGRAVGAVRVEAVTMRGRRGEVRRTKLPLTRLPHPSPSCLAPLCFQLPSPPAAAAVPTAHHLRLAQGGCQNLQLCSILRTGRRSPPCTCGANMDGSFFRASPTATQVRSAGAVVVSVARPRRSPSTRRGSGRSQRALRIKRAT